MVDANNAFRIHEGVPLRRNSEGEEVGPDRPDQPNPAFKHNPGIHGWNGIERIDIAPDVPPGDEVDIPSVVIPEIAPDAGQEIVDLRETSQLGSPRLSFESGASFVSGPVITIGNRIIY